jgi:BON domain
LGQVRRIRAWAVALCLLGLSVGCKRAQPVPSDGRVEWQRLEPRAERLERQVRAKLFEDPDLAGSGSIVVIVDGRNVVLEGWVASVNERALAEADAATVPGVTAVDDRLLVRATHR